MTYADDPAPYSDEDISDAHESLMHMVHILNHHYPSQRLRSIIVIYK
jgi:hypothetical protein